MWIKGLGRAAPKGRAYDPGHLIDPVRETMARTDMTQVPSRSWSDTPELAPKGKKAVPEGLWIRCLECAAMLFRKSVENNLWVCPECRYHFRISARQRIRQLTDPGSFEPFNERMTPVDPLSFVDLRPYT